MIFSYIANISQINIIKGVSVSNSSVSKDLVNHLYFTFFNFYLFLETKSVGVFFSMSHKWFSIYSYLCMSTGSCFAYSSRLFMCMIYPQLKTRRGTSRNRPMEVSISISIQFFSSAPCLLTIFGLSVFSSPKDSWILL